MLESADTDLVAGSMGAEGNLVAGRNPGSGEGAGCNLSMLHEGGTSDENRVLGV